jgi:hypothetical protein
MVWAVVVRRPVRHEVRVGVSAGVAGVPVVALVARGGREHVAEHLIQPLAHPIGDFVHPTILHRCDDGPMGFTEKAKELTDTALQKAEELSATAREKAPSFFDKAADVTVKAVDATASGIDRATGGRFHDKLEGAAAKVDGSLDRPRPPYSTSGPVDPEPSTPAPKTTPPTPPTTGTTSPGTPKP